RPLPIQDDELRPRFIFRRAGSQAADCEQPVRRPTRQQALLVPNGFRRRQWYPYVRNETGQESRELRWRDAADDERDAIEVDRATDDGSFAPEALAPETMADHDSGCGAGRAVVDDEAEPPDHSLYAEHVEVIVGHVLRLRQLTVTAAHPAHRRRVTVEGEHAGECA